MTTTRHLTLSAFWLASLVLTGCAESADRTDTPQAASAPAPVATPAVVAGVQPAPPTTSISPNGEEHAVLATLETSPTWSRTVGGQVSLVLDNRGTASARYTIASGMLADVMLSQGKQVYWRYSEEMMFTQALTSLTLAPGETRTVRVQVPASRLGQLKPGKYTVSALLNTHPREAAPAIKPVTITLK